MLLHALTDERPISLDGPGTACGVEGFVTSWNEAVTCLPCREVQCWHYLIEPARDGQSLLCGRAGEFYVPEGATRVHITILRDRVTCPVCLEWLHA